MVQSVSFSTFGTNVKNMQKSQGKPPKEFLDELKQAGIPESVISQGRAAIEAYAKNNNVTLPNPPKPPEGPAGSKSQGAEHANKNSILNSITSESVKNLMAQNQILSTGVLKDDIATIKSTIASLDKDGAKILADKFKEVGLSVASEHKNAPSKQTAKGADQLASLNKHFLINKSSKKIAS